MFNSTNFFSFVGRRMSQISFITIFCPSEISLPLMQCSKIYPGPNSFPIILSRMLVNGCNWRPSNVIGCTDSGKSYTLGTLKKSFQPEYNSLIQNLAVDMYFDPKKLLLCVQSRMLWRKTQCLWTDPTDLTRIKPSTSRKTTFLEALKCQIKEKCHFLQFCKNQ